MKPKPPPEVTRIVQSGPDHLHLMGLDGWVLGDDYEMPSGEVISAPPGKRWRVRVVPQPRPIPGKYPLLVQEDRP